MFTPTRWGGRLEHGRQPPIARQQGKLHVCEDNITGYVKNVTVSALGVENDLIFDPKAVPGFYSEHYSINRVRTMECASRNQRPKSEGQESSHCKSY